MLKSFSVILLFNDKGKFLLQHRTNDARRNPGLWGFFGGKIEENETPLQAVIRETHEELTYSLHQPTQIMKKEFVNSKNETFFMYVFVEKYDQSQILKQREGQNMKWVDKKECNLLEVIDNDLKVINLLPKDIIDKI